MKKYDVIQKISFWFFFVFLSYLIGDLVTKYLINAGVQQAIGSFFHVSLYGLTDLWWLVAAVIVNIFLFKFKVNIIGDWKNALILSIPIFVYVLYNSIAFGIFFNGNAISIFLGTLLVGLVEEYIFRGTLKSNLESVGASKWTIVIVSILIFGLFHLNNLALGQSLQVTIQQAIYTALYGVFNMAIYLRTKSVLILAIGHALYNWSVQAPGNILLHTNIFVHTYLIGAIFAAFGVWYLRKVEV